MSNLTLDGGTSFIGTEFIKLLATGSSPLATEEYVDDKVADAIGGSSADSYTKSETDDLLNAKLNVSNPYVSGNLRIQPLSQNGKLIINTTSPLDNTFSFFCNGKGEFNSTLKTSVLNCSNDITAGGINANTFNVNNINTKISFNDDAFEYMKYENPNVDASFYGLKVLSNLYTKDIFPESIKIPYNNKISFIDTNGATDLDYYDDNYINITIADSIQRINQVIMGNGEHRFYNGSIDTANDGYLTLKMSNSRIYFYKDLYLNGSSIADTLNCNGNIETASTLKTNNFENYDDNNIIFTHNSVNYLQFNKDTGTDILPNGDATVKVPVIFECGEKIKTLRSLDSPILNNTNALSAPIFQHLGIEYMRFEDLALNASTQGIKMARSLYTQDINPTQIKMTYNTKISFADSDGGTDGDYFNDNYIMMSIADTIPRLNYVVIDGSEHRFYVGDIGTAFDGDMVMKLSKDRIDFYKPIYDGGQPLSSSSGYTDGEIDTFLTGKLTIATPETITGKLVVETTGTQMALGDLTADREIAITDGDCIDCSEKAVSNNPAELKIKL